jgi:hypothetical protein
MSDNFLVFYAGLKEVILSKIPAEVEVLTA